MVAPVVHQNGDCGQVILRGELFKAGKIGGNFRKAKRIMDKRRFGPRTAQIFERIFPDDSQNAVVNQPGRGAERGRFSSRELLKTAHALFKPLLDPPFGFLRQIILPAAMVPGMKLYFVAFIAFAVIALILVLTEPVLPSSRQGPAGDASADTLKAHVVAVAKPRDIGNTAALDETAMYISDQLRAMGHAPLAVRGTLWWTMSGRATERARERRGCGNGR